MTGENGRDKKSQRAFLGNGGGPFCVSRRWQGGTHRCNMGPPQRGDDMEIDELPDEVRAAYTHMRKLPDGRICGVHRLLFHWTLHVDIDGSFYADRYCYATALGCLTALMEWNGEGDPEGWHKHPTTGRRRDPERRVEWDEGEYPHNERPY